MEIIICVQTKITTLTKTSSILLFFSFVFHLLVKMVRCYLLFCVKKEIYIYIDCNWQLARIRGSWSTHDESMTYIYCSFNFYIDREHNQLVDEPTSNIRDKWIFLLQTRKYYGILLWTATIAFGFRSHIKTVVIGVHAHKPLCVLKGNISHSKNVRCICVTEA